MNAQEAKEIIKNTPDEFNIAQPRILYFEAKAYLEALNGPEVRELVEALEHADKVLTAQKFYRAQGRLMTVIDQALSKFKSILGDEKK